MYDDAGKRNIWVCAYANNQHDLSELDVEDPRLTPFFKAMQLSEVCAISACDQM